MVEMKELEIGYILQPRYDDYAKTKTARQLYAENISKFLLYKIYVYKTSPLAFDIHM